MDIINMKQLKKKIDRLNAKDIEKFNQTDRKLDILNMVQLNKKIDMRISKDIKKFNKHAKKVDKRSRT